MVGEKKMIDKIEPMEDPEEGELMKDVNRRWLEKFNEMFRTFNDMAETFNSMTETWEEWEVEQERIQRLLG